MGGAKRQGKLQIADCRNSFLADGSKETEGAGSSLKRRSPGVQARASGNEINFQEEIVMSKNITDASNVIQFNFGKQQVRTLVLDDQPWFFAIDVCGSLGLADTNKALIGLDDDEKCEHEQYSGSGRKPILINESGLYSLILRSRKPEAKRFKKWVTAEVLPTIRKHGRYEDSSNKMAVLVDDVIGVSGTNLVNGVISQKVAVLPTGIQRQARHKLHAILHTRFNVPRTELIPAEKLDVACEYLAAYALEGEFIPKPEAGRYVLSDSEMIIVSHICHSAAWVWYRWNQGIEQSVKHLNYGLHVKTFEHFQDLARQGRSLDRMLAEPFADLEARHKLGGMRPSHYTDLGLVA